MKSKFVVAILALLLLLPVAPATQAQTAGVKLITNWDKLEICREASSIFGEPQSVVDIFYGPTSLSVAQWFCQTDMGVEPLIVSRQDNPIKNYCTSLGYSFAKKKKVAGYLWWAKYEWFCLF